MPDDNGYKRREGTYLRSRTRTNPSHFSHGAPVSYGAHKALVRLDVMVGDRVPVAARHAASGPTGTPGCDRRVAACPFLLPLCHTRTNQPEPGATRLTPNLVRRRSSLLWLLSV